MPEPSSDDADDEAADGCRRDPARRGAGAGHDRIVGSVPGRERDDARRPPFVLQPREDSRLLTVQTFERKCRVGGGIGRFRYFVEQPLQVEPTAAESASSMLSSMRRSSERWLTLMPFTCGPASAAICGPP